MQKHSFKQNKVNSTCNFKDESGAYCNKRAKHIVHKAVKVSPYKPGEIVGKYVVQSNGSFKKIEEK